MSKPKPSTDSFSAHEIDSIKPSYELSAPIIENVIAAGETNTDLDISEYSKV